MNNPKSSDINAKKKQEKREKYFLQTKLLNFKCANQSVHDYIAPPIKKSTARYHLIYWNDECRLKTFMSCGVVGLRRRAEFRRKQRLFTQPPGADIYSEGNGGPRSEREVRDWSHKHVGSSSLQK